MLFETTRYPFVPPWQRLGPLIAVGALLIAALFVAGSLLAFGVWGILLLVWVLALSLAALFPERAAILLIILGIAIEPGAIDFTNPIAVALYETPDVVANALPITMGPFEILILTIALALAVRPKPVGAPPVSLPLLVWGLFGVLAIGALYGLYKGAPSNLVSPPVGNGCLSAGSTTSSRGSWSASRSRAPT